MSNANSPLPFAARTGVWVSVLALLCALVGPLTAARAADAVSGLAVVPGVSRVTASWDAVAGATSYRLEVSTRATMAKPRSATTATTTKTLTGLKKKTTYYVRVSATVDGQVLRSAVRTVQTTPASPGRGVLTAEAAGTTTIRATWQPFRQATALELRVSWDDVWLKKADKDRTFTVKGIPVTATSQVITIPQGFLAYLGSGSGNPAYLELVARNGSKKTTSPIVVAWPGAPAATGASLRVASYNVVSVAASRDVKGRTWADRRTAVKRTIELAAPDVLAVQEATTADVTIDGEKLDQYQDLAGLLEPTYRLAYDSGVVGNAGENETKGDHIFYRPEVLSVVDAGVDSGHALPGTNWGSALDRYFGWARLRVKQSGREFFVVSVHLLPGTSASLVKLRNQVVVALDAYFHDPERNPDGLPVIMAGDLNAGITTYPDGPATALVKAGYTDAAAATNRTGQEYSTSNGGYPTRPATYAWVGNRIDYILADGASPIRYVNQLKLDDGCFDPAYQGSDHNLQWTDLVLQG